MSATTPSNHVRHVGRPTKFNEESAKRLCAAVGDGMPIKGLVLWPEVASPR